MRYLAVDYGAARTGLALCDAEETIAFPLEVLAGPKGLVERIADVVRREEIEAVVVGMPLNMDGSEGGQADKVKAFAACLGGHLSVPVYFQDERLSSFGAAEKLGQTGLSRAKRKKRLDALAAAEILQAFLDGKKRGPAPPEGAV
jgi:putative Holliday junction resolvase